MTACFFGDGTTNIGAFHEAVNLAAVWRLPALFVCENNQYMEYTPIADVIPWAARGRPRAGLRPERWWSTATTSPPSARWPAPPSTARAAAKDRR